MPLSESDNKLKVFLCHSSHDKPFVRELYRKFLDEGMEPWLDEESLHPGQEWDSEIRTAIRNSDVVVVCLSRNSVSKAGYLQKEIKLALDVADEQPEEEIFLIPIRIDDCPLPKRLSHLHSPPIDDRDNKKLLTALKVRATSLGRYVPSETPPPDVGQLMGSCFSQAFSQVFWEQFPDSISLKSKQSFSIGMVGEMATGKTSLGSVLVRQGFDFFSQRTRGFDFGFNLFSKKSNETEPYVYKFPINNKTYITDHHSYSIDKGIRRNSLAYLNSSTDLILFLTCPDKTLGKSDCYALEELKEQNTPIVIVANKLDLLSHTQMSEYFKSVQNSTELIPLPVSSATGQNLDLLRRFFRKSRLMYV